MKSMDKKQAVYAMGQVFAIVEHALKGSERYEWRQVHFTLGSGIELCWHLLARAKGLGLFSGSDMDRITEILAEVSPETFPTTLQPDTIGAFHCGYAYGLRELKKSA